MPKTINNKLGETFYQLTEAEAREWYRLKYINTTAYLLIIKRLLTKPNVSLTIPNVLEFCRQWEISKSSFYRAVDSLSRDGKFTWEATQGIILNPCQKVLTIPRAGHHPTSGTPSHERDTDSHERDTDSHERDTDSHERDTDSHERDTDIYIDRARVQIYSDLNRSNSDLTPLSPLDKGGSTLASVECEVSVSEEECRLLPEAGRAAHEILTEPEQLKETTLITTQNLDLDKYSGRVATRAKKNKLTKQELQYFLEAYQAEKPSNFTNHRDLSEKHIKGINKLATQYGTRSLEIFVGALTWVREQDSSWWRDKPLSLDNLMSNGKLVEFADKHFDALESDKAYCDRVEGRAPSHDSGRKSCVILNEHGEELTGASAQVAQALIENEFLRDLIAAE